MLILLLAVIGGQARRLTQQRFEELSWMSAFYLDILQGLPTLKLFGRSREQAANIEQISRHYGNTTLKVLATAFQSSLVMEWAATAATAMVALEVSLRLVGGTISFAPGLAVLLLTPEFFMPLRQLAIKYHAGAAGKAAGERIFGILAEPAGSSDSLPVTFPPAAPLPLALGDITFTQVSYIYPAAGDPAAGDPGQVRPAALQDVSFVIPQGKITALVGHSGAGKSTVANLLLRFALPTLGQITVGPTDLAHLDPAAWRAQVGWVPQRPHLFAGDGVENIRLGMPHADFDAVIAAAKAAHADEFLARLPQGYATPLGEGASRLSGGQRQRVAIARAFLKNAPILILDEPGANLDAESEALIRDALQRLMRGRTVLLIAHGLGFAAAANHVVRLEAGRVITERLPAVPAVEETGYR
jgi:ATP-binding cassette subfamily C protein CydD